MNSTLFKIIGMLTGISIIGLAVAWSPDPNVGSSILFFGGVLVFVGSVKKVVNSPQQQEKNHDPYST